MKQQIEDIRAALESAKFDLEVYLHREKKNCEETNKNNAVKFQPISPPALRYIEKALQSLSELEERLEISPDHSYDGIATRDETIKILEKRVEELEAQLQKEKPDA